MRARDRLLDLIFPPRCPVCGRVTVSGEVFCAPCFEELLRTRTPRAPGGGRQNFSAFVNVADYDKRTEPAILRLKRIPDSAEAEVFGKALAKEILQRWPEAGFTAVVPVPLSESKLRRRGFNQSETLAAHIAKALDAPLRCDLLLQRDEAPAQHTLTRSQRVLAAARQYAALPGAAVSGRVLLVDDVLTTGATLDRCAGLLKSAGAGDVVAAAAVFTP